VELRRAHEVRRGAERALEQTDATMNALQCKTSQIEEENKAMVQHIVGLTKELQEAMDSKEEARLLRRQRVQMFREVPAHVMEAARRLGIEGLSLPLHPRTTERSCASSASLATSWWRPLRGPRSS
jgi:hypothetical protein